MINKVINLGEADEKGVVPTLTTYVLDDPLEQKRKRGSVLICPGGAYSICSPREAEPIALMFNVAGYHAFVLNYSVAPKTFPTALCEVSKAMCLIRENAEEWCVAEDKIAVCGFSAGGHLAASFATLWNSEKAIKRDDQKNKPNGAILCYPVITSGEKAHRGSFENLLGKDKDNKDMLEYLSLENRVSKDTPQTFLWHTFSDDAVPVENSLMFANALRKNDVPFEMHIYPKGCPGLSLATKEVCDESGVDFHVATWAKLACQWLDKIFE